jgi:hypothetical protein
MSGDSPLYLLVRDLHNLNRGLIVLAAAHALFVSYRGWLGRGEWTAGSAAAGRRFVTLLHLQLVLGIALWLLSPLVGTARQDIALALSNRDQRFFGLEHPVQMVSAIVIATIGAVQARKAAPPALRFRRAALWHTAAILLILAAIPWPFSSHVRPWMPRLEWLHGRMP